MPREATSDGPHVDEVAWLVHVSASMGRQILQTRSVEEVALVDCVLEVPKFSQARV